MRKIPKGFKTSTFWSAAVAIAVATAVYTYYASKQWEAMNTWYVSDVGLVWSAVPFPYQLNRGCGLQRRLKPEGVPSN